MGDVLDVAYVVTIIGGWAWVAFLLATRTGRRGARDALRIARTRRGALGMVASALLGALLGHLIAQGDVSDETLRRAMGALLLGLIALLALTAMIRLAVMRKRKRDRELVSAAPPDTLGPED